MAHRQDLAAEIVTTGTEILLGDIVDTNAAWIAQQLRDIGVNLYYKSTVGDNEPRLRGVLELALSRSNIIIVTGGLGPTVDDITRQAIANATGRKLVLHAPTLEALEKRFSRWGSRMTENNRQQAYLPEGAILIPNPVGTAPGFIVEGESGTVIALPGVPREMKHMMKETVLPYLQRLGGGGVIRRRILRTVGIGESTIDARINDLMHNANPTVGLAAHLGQADIRIAARAATIAEADALLDQMEAELRSRLGQYIYSTTPGEKVEAVVAQKLRQNGVRVAIYETSTTGSVAERLKQAGGDDFDPVVAAWSSQDMPDDLLPAEARAQLAASEISEELARQVAVRVREHSGADVGLAILSTGRSDEGLYAERTGETWLAVANGQGVKSSQFPYGGTDELTAAWVGNRALDMLRRLLHDQETGE